MTNTVSCQNALDNNYSFDAIYNILAYLYIGCLILIGIFFGLSPMIYGAIIIASMIFIMPSTILGINIIIFMTMIFERWFTLQPLITENIIYKIYPLDIVIIMAIVGWILMFFLEKNKKIIFGLTEKILIIFIMLNSLYLIQSFYEINANLAVAFSTFKNYAFYPLLYFLIIYTIQNKKDFKNTIHIILLSGLSIIGFIVIGLMRGNGLWTEYTPLSTDGVRFLAGTHAFYLILCVLISSSLLAFERFRNRNFVISIIVIWIIGIILSLMRHLWLSFGIGIIALLVLMPIANQKRIFKASFGSMLIITTLILIIVLIANFIPLTEFSQNIDNLYKIINERVTSIASGSQDTSINWRINFWHVAKESWMQNPLFGLGFGRSLPFEIGEWQTFEEVRNIHNSPLAITIQAGIIGIALFIFFVISNLLTGLNFIFKDEELKPYYIGLLACLVVMIFASLFQPYLETNLTGIFFWILLGLISTSRTINADKK